MEILILVISALLFSITNSTVTDSNDSKILKTSEVRVGLVVDLGSIEGKIFKTSLTLALSDFYRINNGYRTRVSVLVRDSRGDPLLALAAARNLVKKARAEIIVGAQSLEEAKLLAAISDKTKIVVISALVPYSLSLNKYNHFIQWTHDTASEAKGIASLVHNFGWRSIVVLYEDVDDWSESLPILVKNFQRKDIRIARFESFALSSGDNHMVNQLRKVKDSSGSKVFVVHMSKILVSRLFPCVEKLGMMEQGYAWILTTRTMNHFRYTDGTFATSSMQGVVGFRSYLPVSKEVENFTSRREELMGDDDTETKSFNHLVVSARAHNIACILANVIEKRSLRGKATRSDATEASWNVSDLVKSIKHSRRFKGLSHGDIQIKENDFFSETFEIMNIVGIKETRVGIWSSGSFSKRRRIIWPGGSYKVPPTHRFLAENGEKKKLLRVLVTAGNRVPNLVRVSPDPETGVVTVTGLCMEIFKTCIDPLNYEMEFIPYNGSYDDLAYLLSTQRDKYDAAAGDITITPDRSSYVEFTLPFTDIGIGALALKKKKHGMWMFFDPFEKSLWLASGAFFILTGIVVWLVERPVNPEFQGSWQQQLGIMLWFGFSTIVFAHRERLQKMSSRFLVIVWMFVVLILTSSYNANLTSTKTISRIQLDNQHAFGPRMMNISNSINAIEAYAQILRDGNLSYVVDEIPYLNVLLGKYPNAFAITDTEASTNGFGFMFHKGSGLAPRVSREIAKLRTSGTLKDMEKRWYQKMDSFYVDSNDDASDRFTFGELGGLFIIAGTAHVLVLVLHLFQARQEILRFLCESRLFTKLKSSASFWRC